MSQDCCSMTLLTFRPLSTSQLATLSMSTSTSQSVELVVDVNVAVSGASCRQRLSVSSVVTPFLMTSHSVLRRRQNWRHISIFILKLYHIWITLSLVLQCCTSDFVSLSLSLSLSFCNTQKNFTTNALFLFFDHSSLSFFISLLPTAIRCINLKYFLSLSLSLSLSLMHKNTMAQVHSSSSFLFTLALVCSFTYYLHPYRCINYKYLSLSYIRTDVSIISIYRCLPFPYG